MIYICMDEIPI